MGGGGSYPTNVSNAGSPVAPSAAAATSLPKGRGFVPRGFGAVDFSSPLSLRGDARGGNSKDPIALSCKPSLWGMNYQVANHQPPTGLLRSQDSTHPTISTASSSDVTIITTIHADGTRTNEFNPPPRLHRWNEIRRCGGAVNQSTDNSLRQIQQGEQFNRFNNVERDQRVQEDYMSSETDRLRRRFFAFTMVASILPFIAPVALVGGFNCALSWYTHGKVDGFTETQKRWLFAEMIFVFMAFVTVVVWAVLSNLGQH